MGHNDDMGDDRPDLPPEAGAQTPRGFEPNDEWLYTAEPELRHEAMRLWFVTRYWDPANDTPYNGREGGYLYIHGGPYDAEDELYGRFGDVFPDPDDTIREVIDDVEADGILEWAPIHTELEDYDADFELDVNRRSDPYSFFGRRLADLDLLVDTNVGNLIQPLLLQLVYSSLIAALEAYLADTMSYWLAVDSKVFRRFVSEFEEFRKEKLSVSEIYDRLSVLEEDVEQHLQKLVWHRLDKIVPLMSASLAIERPAIGELMKQILIRHDIVHRGGKTKDGKNIIITDADLHKLRSDVTAFVNHIEHELEKRFGTDPSPGF